VSEADSTCWTVIRGAARGEAAARDEFVARYAPVVRAYLGARWRGSALASEAEDAAQEVFLDCFKEGGAVARADAGRPGGFRPFLFGIARNVALRFERSHARRRARPSDESFDADGLAARDDPLSAFFDRAFATAVVREAARRQAERAERQGEAAVRRVEILRLRFHDGLPIRDVAARLGEDPARVHHEYARAREEFRAALDEVVAFHHPGSPEDARQEADRLLDALL
jgi:RNA polymerase sigma-70 factor (ECF subfamily)